MMDRYDDLWQTVDALKAHALSNYDTGGWDVIVECYDDDQIYSDLAAADAYTLDDAIAVYARVVDVWADRQADAENSAF